MFTNPNINEENSLLPLKKKMLALIQQLVDTIYLAFSSLCHFLIGHRPALEKKVPDQPVKKTIWDIPGPLALPVLGTDWVYLIGLWKTNRMHERYRYLYDNYGPVVREEALFNVPVVHLFEKEEIETVFRCVSKYPLRPPTEAIAHYRKSNPERYASVGLINEQGPTWNKLRHELTPGLMSPRTIAHFLPELTEIISEWCRLLEKHRDPNGNVSNIDQLAGRLGLEISCALVLGKRMGFLVPESESAMAEEFAKAVHEHFIATRDTYFGLPLWKLFPTPTYKKLIRNEDKIYRIASEIIDSRENESPILESILRADIDDREKSAAIIDFLAAGVHTLKNSLLFLLHLTASNREIQDKIIKEPTIDYAKACVMESFRYLPTACTLARITDQDLTLGGYNVKSGNVVVCHTGIACRDEGNFKEANTFKPERWLGDEKFETVAGGAFILSPFGIGRRICPGKRFMEHVLPIILNEMVSMFVMNVEKPLEVEFEFLLSPKAPMSLNLHYRN